MEFKHRLDKNLKAKQSFYIKMAGILNLNEHEFIELIKNIESDPIFEKLKESGAIKRQKHYNRKIASDFLEFDDNIIHQNPIDSDISEIWILTK